MSHGLGRTITTSLYACCGLPRQWLIIFLLLLLQSTFVVPLNPVLAQSIPSPEEVPEEEVARLQPIEHARSPEDNRLLTPAEYALLQEELQKAQETRAVSPRLRQLILLLRVRKVIKTIIPFF
jgi:hypothetical protein